jgi:hypothetical protein
LRTSSRRKKIINEKILDWRPVSRMFEISWYCGLSTSVEALAFKIWRDYVTNMIHNAPFASNNTVIGNNNIFSRIQAKVVHFEVELPKLKDATTILEMKIFLLRRQLTTRRKSRLMNQALENNAKICINLKYLKVVLFSLFSTFIFALPWSTDHLLVLQ